MKSLQQNYVIYKLIDPRNNSVRYIGYTDHVERRLGEHIAEASKNSAKASWINELLALNMFPILREIEQVNGEDVLKREAYWIQQFKDQGAPLTNVNGVQSGNTEKMTFHFSWEVVEKLDSMLQEYKQRTRKKTNYSKIVRLLIERATLDDIMPYL